MVVEVTQRFAAPPEQVFALLTDVERMAGLGPEHQEAHWDDDTRTSFTGRNQIGDMGWTVPCTVTVMDAPRAFGWKVGTRDDWSSTWDYTLTPDGEGTLVTQRFQHGPGMSSLRFSCDKRPDKAELYIAMRADSLRANMTTVLQAAAGLDTATP